MGGRVSSLTRRIAPRLSSPPSSNLPPPDLSHLPPRAVAQDFAKWQQVQQQRLEQEKWHTQRMLQEQQKELQAKQAAPPQQTQTQSPDITENVNQPISLAEAYNDIQKTPETPDTKNVRGAYIDELDDIEFQQALKKLSASMPLQSQVPESVEFSRAVTQKSGNEIGLLHWENWVEVLQLHNYNPTKWTPEKLAEHFKVDPTDLSHVLKYIMLPHLNYGKKQVTAHWQTEISTYKPPAKEKQAAGKQQK